MVYYAVHSPLVFSRGSIRSAVVVSQASEVRHSSGFWNAQRMIDEAELDEYALNRLLNGLFEPRK